MSKYDETKVKLLLQEPETRCKGFRMLVDQYSELMYWKIRHIVLNHDDANDVLQNTFIKAWNSLDTFRGDSKLSTWLYRISINESIDFIRKKKNMQYADSDVSEASVFSQLMADEYFDGDETQALLQDAISNLPEVQQLVFNMHYFDNMKYSEMSKILDTTEGALKASYHIAVKKISDFIKSHD